MVKFDITTNITWHDVLVRVGLVAATVALIVWALPRDTRTKFDYRVGEPWRHSKLTAMFQFDKFRSEEAIRADKDSLMRIFKPYYTAHPEVQKEQVEAFRKSTAATTDLSPDLRVAVINRLNALYQHHIIDVEDGAVDYRDSTRAINVVRGKVAEAVPVSEVVTAKQAYELLMADPLISYYRDPLSHCNLNEYVVPNLIYDADRSNDTKNDLLGSVATAQGHVMRGETIVNTGDIVSEDIDLKLQSYIRELDKRFETQQNIGNTILGQALFVFLLITAFTIYLSIFRKDYFERFRSAAMIYSLIVLFVVACSLLEKNQVLHIYFIPFAMVPIFIRVFMDSRTAFMAHFIMLLICSLTIRSQMEFIAVETLAGLTAIYSLRELSSRSQLFWTAVLVTIVAIVTKLAIALTQTDFIWVYTRNEYNYLVAAGIMIFCSYPFLYIVERAFGFTSDITLIELSDLNKELLRRMSEVAPGTFQHSIQVGNLAAEIARKLGANTQLVRTGALYHDIGKTVNPIYFTENQSGGISPHSQMSCIESAQMIISHVTEGLRLSDRYNLPESIRNFIATHHGLGKARFFYVKYKNEHPDEPVDDLLFTYPGPNPFTKEQAILMMADSVEAASRSLPDYTEHTIRDLVTKIIDGMVTEGYFRECPITFRDIAYAKTVLIEKLKTIYHTRISYPELKKGEG